MPTPEEKQVLRLLSKEWDYTGPPGIMTIGDIVSAVNQAPSETITAITALFQNGMLDMDALKTSAFLTPEGYEAANDRV